MDIKRLLTSVIGLPLVCVILILGNAYITDILLMIIAIVCMKEYFNVISKVAHPMEWLGYLSTVIIALVPIMTLQDVQYAIMFGIPILLLILFFKVIITNMETTFKDVAYTFLGIMYITFFIMFLSLIRNLEYGKIMLGYVIIVAWATDIFAYLIGRRWGKHKFSKVSPKKSIEGCVAGVIGAVACCLLYAFISINFFGVETKISYILIAILSLVFSVISQIGDFIASSIKRFADMKDYGNLLPGHGGMLDRIDSVIFIAPFVYMVIYLL